MREKSLNLIIEDLNPRKNIAYNRTPDHLHVKSVKRHDQGFDHYDTVLQLLSVCFIPRTHRSSYPTYPIIRTHHHSSFCFLLACAGGRHSGRCAPWRATGARRAVRTSPRVGGSSSCGDRTALQSRRERPQQLRPSERGGHVYLGWLPVVHLLRKDRRLGHSGNGATPTAAAFATAQTGGLQMGDGLMSGAGAPSPTNNLCPRPRPQCAESLRLFFLPHDGHTTHMWPGARRQPTS